MSTISIIVLFVLLAIGIMAFVAGVRKTTFRKKGFIKFLAIFIGVILIVYSLAGLGAQFGLYETPDAVSGIFFAAAPLPDGGIIVGGAQVSGTPGIGQVNTFQPTASYTAIDEFTATTSISGTQYYKLNGNKATTTAQTNVNAGGRIEYWVDNSTYWVQPRIVDPVQAGVNPVQAKGLVNGTATVSLYDQVGRTDVTSGVSNVSMGANKQANIEITYQGSAEASSGPFGGIFLVEYNSTIPSVICSGPQIQTSNPFHLTWTVLDTANTFKQWAYTPSLDDATGSVNRIQCQFKNGATAAGDETQYTVSFIPADYYVSNSGNIVLDTEKFENQDTTRTGTAKNLPTAHAHWGS